MFSKSLSPRLLVLCLFLTVALCIGSYLAFTKVRVELPFKEVNSTVFSTIEETKPENISITVEKGHTLSKIMSDLGINGVVVNKIDAALSGVKNKFILSIGDKVIIEDNRGGRECDEQYVPSSIDFIKKDKVYNLEYDTLEEKYNLQVSDVPVETYTNVVTGKVQGNIFSAARIKGVDANTIMSFINLYSFLIDFQRDIKSGDEFQIYYEYQVDPYTQKVKDSKILYASLSNAGKKKEIFRHQLKSGEEDYFDADGNSIRSTLLKTPVSGARISSRFGPRKHPVLGYSRMHKGLDYAAPTGTPVYAAGEGIVSFVKNSKRGYGKHIQIRHNSTYSTLYGHLSRFAKGIKPGSRVVQGQVIGYVGKTGLASGPHLHYEVKERGKQINPTKIAHVKKKPLKKDEFELFKKNVALYKVIIENTQSATMVADIN